MYFGIITYKQYEENVLLNAHFSIVELFEIILKDKDFVKFEIFDQNRNLKLSTNFNDVEEQGIYICPLKVEREEEVIGIEYYAFRTPSTIRKTKVRWEVGNARFRVKKKAFEYAEQKNNGIAKKIEPFINYSNP